jgi:FkbM family methyltransferase
MTALGGSLRRLASVAPVASFLDWYPVRRVVATLLRSATVRSRGRFVVRELTGRRGVSGYRLRESGRCVFVRHGTADVVTLDEVFYTRNYALPAAVAGIVDSLGRPPRVLDLGANIGLFGIFVLERYPEARIVAIEADAANAEVLRRCIAANDGNGRWQVVEAAASNRDGTVDFVAGGYSLSHLAGPEEPSVRVPAVDVFPYLADADLLKMDIEGGEWAILGDRRLAEVPVRALVLEFHPHLCPEPSPRRAVSAALEAAGFEHRLTGGEDYGMAWAWRLGGGYTATSTASSRSTGTSPTRG